METRLIRQIEELAANAWPAEVIQVIDGWRCRYSAGITRRANSVLPNDDGGAVPLPEKLALVEQFYRRRGLPARYQISPAVCPPELDALLAERGYGTAGLTCIQTAALRTVLARSAGPPLPGPSIGDAASEEWLSVYTGAESMSAEETAMRRALLRRIGPMTGYALLRLDGEPAAVGLGVLERGWLGIFCMTTRPPFRRRGAAAAVLRSLAAWGLDQGAESAYLQVSADNAAARALYERVGFETLYHYHYRESSAG